jgi:hypothetical protein
MCSHRKIVAGIIASALLIGFLKTISQPTSMARWEVLVTTLPVTISTQNAHINTVYYVLRQTHEPILHKNDGQNYTSKILENWSHDLGYLRYTFCPKMGLSFGKDLPFTREIFSSHLFNITRNFEKGFVLKADKACDTVVFSAPQKSYLDYLTLYENAPTLPVASNFDIGLGPFYIKTLENKKIVLLRKQPVSNGYSEIILHLYKGVYDPIRQNRDISDFNLIPATDVPEWVKNGHTGFDTVELKSRNLIINHPDAKVRKLIRNCLDVDRFRRAYVPRQTEFLDLQTVLPMGLAGAKAGLPIQNCKDEMLNVHLSTPIIYLNNREDNFSQMRSFAENFKKKTGVAFNVVKYPLGEMAAIKLQRPRPYNLIVVVIDAVVSNHEAFFGPFLDSSGYHDFDVTVLRKLHGELLRTGDPQLKLDIVNRMIAELDNQNVVLTLYQVKGKLYYPKDIKNIEVGKGFLQYPEVADLRW